MAAEILLGVAIWVVASIALAPLVGWLIRGAERLAEVDLPPEDAAPQAPGNRRAAA